jgi:hypothetical protein
MIRLVLLSLLVFAAPPAPKTTAEDFYPAKVGTKWVYEDQTGELTSAVSAVERKAGETVVTVLRDHGAGPPSPLEILVLSENGMFRVEAGGMKFDQPVCLVRFPIREGDKWDVKVSGPKQLKHEKGSATTVGFEEVEVPAGKFKALRVEKIVTTSTGVPLRSTFWYAPGVGLVKMNHVGLERVLKTFTPAKE